MRLFSEVDQGTELLSFSGSRRPQIRQIIAQVHFGIELGIPAEVR